MFKKAGLVVAAATVGLLAVSPLAFANSQPAPPEVENHGNASLLNLSDNDLVAPIEACNNDVPVNAGAAPVQGNVKDLTGAVAGAAALLGTAQSENQISTDSARSCDTAVANND
ncbi:hypothetical protein [Pseudonocardia lacus]|uniref:hypothetical protein n=1 Tax=Pseudonocardia lacus TaxID=2835865 RepID=UPI001BDDC434|nr:hypothetical protein [Pseudonocardia lacus]